MSIEQIMNEMAQDIGADIHGDIYGHERWAEEIFCLRQRVKDLEAKVVEMSWEINPDRSGGQWTEEEVNRFGMWN